jgi:hypothetical protein
VAKGLFTDPSVIFDSFQAPHRVCAHSSVAEKTHLVEPLIETLPKHVSRDSISELYFGRRMPVCLRTAVRLNSEILFFVVFLVIELTSMCVTLFTLVPAVVLL